MRTATTRLLALFLAFAVLGAACGSDDDAPAVDVTALGPSVAIDVIPDAAGGVNIAVEPTNYEITAAAPTDYIGGQGHYSLFVDGVKRSRFYNDWIHVAGVDAGEHEFIVTLNANDGSDLEVNGERVEDVVTIDVPEHAHDDHGHDEVDPFEAEGITVSDLVVAEDATSGWNLNVAWDGIDISPEHASGDHVDGEGHLHVMVNGEKLERIYGADMHIASLPAGDVTISVAAFTNDHRPYVVDGAPVQDSITLGDTSVGAASVIELELIGDELADGARRETVSLGQPVTIRVMGDSTDTVHVHGYDKFIELTGGAGELTFDALIPGVFEVELENAGVVLVQLEVS